MKQRILLVDDELAILLTLKAVLEIHGFEVETAASAREAKAKIKSHVYHMVITDMRMENESAGLEVVQAAKKAAYNPAVAMLTAFPVAIYCCNWRHYWSATRKRSRGRPQSLSRHLPWPQPAMCRRKRRPLLAPGSRTASLSRQ
jgi:hypothetical protein